MSQVLCAPENISRAEKVPDMEGAAWDMATIDTGVDQASGSSHICFYRNSTFQSQMEK